MRKILDFLPGKKTWLGIIITVVSNAAAIFLKPEEKAVVDGILDFIKSNPELIGQVAGPILAIYGLVMKKVSGREI